MCNGQIGYMGLFQFLCFAMLPWLLSRIYVLWHLSELFYRHLLGPFDVRSYLILLFLCLFFFCPDDLFLVKSGSLRLTTTMGLVLICVFKSMSMLCIKFGAPVFGSYTFSIVIFLLINWSKHNLVEGKKRQRSKQKLMK